MEDNQKFSLSSDNEKDQLINNFENHFKEFKDMILEHLGKYNNKYISNIDDFYKNKLNETKNIDKLMENEEKLYFDSILDKFSNYDNIYDNFKEKNNINDISLQSKIFINDYNRSYINKDSIKTEFRFGWFLLYSSIKGEWIKSSIIIIIIMQIIPILLCLLDAIIRFISFRCKSERLFKLSSLFL